MDEENEWKRLNWRLDPEISFSDFTIIVEREPDSPVEGSPVKDPLEAAEDVYHVHRNLLTFGPYASKYFKATFKHKEMVEGKTCCTRIKLNDDLAGLFPLLLDIIYGGESALVEGESSLIDILNMLHLMDYLGVPPMAIQIALYPVDNREWSVEDTHLVSEIIATGNQFARLWCIMGLSRIAKNLEDDENQEAMTMSLSGLSRAIVETGIAGQLMEILLSIGSTNNEKSADVKHKFDGVMCHVPFRASAELVSTFSQFFLQTFSDQIASLAIGDLIYAVTSCSEECFDVLIKSGMVKAMASAQSGTGSLFIKRALEPMSRALLKHPGRVPIDDFFGFFPSAWEQVKDCEIDLRTCPLDNIFVAISRYSDADRQLILNIEGSTSIASALIFPWSDYPHMVYRRDAWNASKELKANHGTYPDGEIVVPTVACPPTSTDLEGDHEMYDAASFRISRSPLYVEILAYAANNADFRLDSNVVLYLTDWTEKCEPEVQSAYVKAFLNIIVGRSQSQIDTLSSESDDWSISPIRQSLLQVDRLGKAMGDGDLSDIEPTAANRIADAVSLLTEILLALGDKAKEELRDALTFDGTANVNRAGIERIASAGVPVGHPHEDLPGRCLKLMRDYFP